MAQQPMIDIKHLNQYVAGDQALRDEILSIYEEQVEIWVSMLDPDADDIAWRDAAHALKGASRGVGAWQLGELCQNAEDMVDGKSNRDLRVQVLKAMQAAVKDTINEVRRLRSVAA